MKRLIKKILIEQRTERSPRKYWPSTSGNNDQHFFQKEKKDKVKALEIANAVDVWWRSQKRIDFFERFENDFIDDYDDAAKEYEKNMSNTWLRQLGSDNHYYTDFVKWFDCIEDEIDDLAFQNYCYLESSLRDGNNKKFYVDTDW